MLERTFSFWRRLAGKPAEATADASSSADTDRRVWVRFPANVETTLQPAGVAEQRLAARVRDISRGGVRLILNRPLDAGQMLNIELPTSGQDEHMVLACIVRVDKLPAGEWSLGCVFSRELTDEDLHGFGARRERHDDADQRLWVRFPCDVQASYEKVSAPDAASAQAHVLNISATGVGLLVSESIEAGALLSIHLRPDAGNTRLTLLGCVVHVSAQANGDCALGCNFIRELTEDDLRGLV